MDDVLDSFMKEPVNITNPPDTTGWSDSYSCSCDGKKMTKTVTRVCTLKNGSKQTINMVFTKDM